MTDLTQQFILVISPSLPRNNDLITTGEYPIAITTCVQSWIYFISINPIILTFAGLLFT